MNRKKIVRNYDNILLALSIALSTFMLMNAIRIVSIGREDTDQSDYPFTANYLVEADKIEVSNIETIAKKATDNGISCYLDGVHFMIGKIFDRMNVLIYLNYKSDNAWSRTANSLIIGHSIHNFVSTKDGKKYVELGALNYSVYSEKRNQLIEDDTILVNWENLTKEYKNSIVERIGERNLPYEQLYITLESDSANKLEEFLNELNDTEQMKFTKCNREDSANYLQSFQDKMLLIVLGILIAFNIICSITISSLWIYRREKEYLICRAFGFHMIQLVFLILKEIFGVFLLAVVMGVAGESFYLYIRGCPLIETSYLRDQAIGLGITLPLILLIITLYPCIKVSRSNLSQSSIDSSV